MYSSEYRLLIGVGNKYKKQKECTVDCNSFNVSHDSFNNNIKPLNLSMNGITIQLQGYIYDYSIQRITIDADNVLIKKN